MKINITGNFFGSDGYSCHTRSLANALNDLEDVEVCMSSNKPADFLRHVSDDELKMIKRNPNDCDINLAITLPSMWPLYMCDNKPFVGFCVWEGNKIPMGWVHILLDKRVSMIFVPSRHTRDAIINTCADWSVKNPDSSEHLRILEKIKIVPHGVSLDLFQPKKELKENKPFTFFASKGWRNLEDRGGNQYAVQAFLEEFNSKDNVEMLIKINPSYSIGNVNEMIDKLKPKDKTDFALINISAENVPYKDMVKFYQMADVFVAPTRAESFHLGCIEAMACGLPVITTNFGGQTDFVNHKNGWIINGKLEEVTWDIMYEGISWLTPDIYVLKEAMRQAYEDWKTNNSKFLNEKSVEALKTASEFTWKNSAKIASAFLNDLN